MTSSPAVRIVPPPATDVDVRALIVPVFEHDTLDDLGDLDAAAAGEIGRLLATGEFKGKAADVVPVALTGCRALRAIVVGAGPRQEWTADRLRRAAAAGALAARARGMGTVSLLVREANAGAVQAAAEGLVLAAHDGDVYKTSPREHAPLREAVLIVSRPDGDLERSAERGRLLGECTNVARALANEPGNRLSPATFAERAESALEGSGLGVEVLDEERLRALNMGLLLGVAQGSAEPPRMIVVRHAAEDAEEGPLLALVGKGITFDTGGISIKPAEGMDRMKTDMAGGAAVIAAMRAIAAARAPIRVVGIVPCAENMPGGRAIRPGDVLASASGRTVEVANTDAEGRLVLADALWYALQLGATHLVDVATLTGSIAIALGRHVSGLFGSETWWTDAVRAAGERAGDRLWPMPIYDEALEQMRSDIADLVNVGGRYGGACTAAAFLREFTGGRPWAHLDIAGTAWADEPKPWQPKGSTGVGVRTLAELALLAPDWRGRP